MATWSRTPLFSVLISNQELVYSAVRKPKWLQGPREVQGCKALTAAAKAGHHPSLEIKSCWQLSAAQRQRFSL